MVLALNFANAYTPGGSVSEGVMAQEECLCRSSNLYAALTVRKIPLTQKLFCEMLLIFPLQAVIMEWG
ncbi:MAG: DUF2263 domain-containing protein [Blautia sp.]|nr:DUF2263 domain-containing protein [Blautia sp.]